MTLPVTLRELAESARLTMRVHDAKVRRVHLPCDNWCDPVWLSLEIQKRPGDRWRLVCLRRDADALLQAIENGQSQTETT